jgi:hypothetical protein
LEERDLNARSQDMNLIGPPQRRRLISPARIERRSSGHKIWWKAENSNLTQFPVPLGFEAVPARLSG